MFSAGLPVAFYLDTTKNLLLCVWICFVFANFASAFCLFCCCRVSECFLSFSLSCFPHVCDFVHDTIFERDLHIKQLHTFRAAFEFVSNGTSPAHGKRSVTQPLACRDPSP